MFRVITSAIMCLLAASTFAPAEAQQPEKSSNLFEKIFGGDTPDLPPDDIELLDGQVVRIFVYLPTVKSRDDVAATGTGFVLNDQGYIVTNYHVVNNVEVADLGRGLQLWKSEARTILVGQAGRVAPVEAKVVWQDFDRDLAILQADRPIGKAAMLSTVHPKRGDRVTAIGFPGIADTSYSAETMPESVNEYVRSKLNAISTPTIGNFQLVNHRPWGVMPTQDNVILEVINHSAEINHGNSGGPLYDQCGRVIGVNTSGPKSLVDFSQDSEGNLVGSTAAAQGVFFSSAVSELTPALKELGIPFSLSDATCTPWEPSQPLDVIGIGFALTSLISLAIAFYALTRKPVRQRLSRVVSSRGSVRPHPRADDNQPCYPGKQVRADSQDSVVLSGLGEAGRMVRFRIQRSQAGRSPDGFVVGRDPQLCHETMQDSLVSKRHARFFWRDGAFMVEDLNATNPVLVNGEAIAAFSPVSLKSGDTLTIGNAQLKVAMST